MAFEQNQQLRRLLDPATLQQMAYDRDQQTNRTLLPTAQQNSRYRFNQLEPLQQTSPFSITPVPDQNSNQGFWSRLGSGIRNYLTGTSPQQISYNPNTPQQSQALQALLSMGSDQLQNPYQGWEDIQGDLNRQYLQQVVPGLAERFTASTGARLSSPSFVQSLNAAGQQFQQNNLQQKLNYGNQNRDLALQLLQLGLRPQMQHTFQPGEPGLFQQLPKLAGKLGAAYLSGGVL